MVKDYKKILVLYTNYGRQRMPEKTNWVMHQYHLGSDEEEKDGELLLSKVFYQTQPRQCGTSIKDSLECITSSKPGASPIPMDYYNFQEVQNGSSPDSTKRLQFRLIPNTTNLQDDDDRCTYNRFASNSSKGKLGSN
ncbi:hypothetical protein MLD38_010056 [Melastoma candidum]|nr:hypothetical protein MLD38_010056 [Melastoma candidum]